MREGSQRLSEERKESRDEVEVSKVWSGRRDGRNGWKEVREWRSSDGPTIMYVKTL